MSKVYVIVFEDGAQELTDLDDGKIMAWERREDAERTLENLGDDSGPLHIESREVPNG